MNGCERECVREGEGRGWWGHAFRVMGPSSSGRGAREPRTARNTLRLCVCVCARVCTCVCVPAPRRPTPHPFHQPRWITRTDKYVRRTAASNPRTMASTWSRGVSEGPRRGQASPKRRLTATVKAASNSSFVAEPPFIPAAEHHKHHKHLPPQRSTYSHTRHKKSRAVPIRTCGPGDGLGAHHGTAKHGPGGAPGRGSPSIHQRRHAINHGAEGKGEAHHGSHGNRGWGCEPHQHRAVVWPVGQRKGTGAGGGGGVLQGSQRQGGGEG